MIQRIQTLYLLGSAVLIGLMFFFPLAHLKDPSGQTLEFLYRGIPSIEEGAPSLFVAYPIAFLLSLIILIGLISIFLYKKRMIQIRLTIFNMICMLGSTGLIYYSINSQLKELDAIANYSVINVFPLVALILSYLALRNIGKDEAMIRSLDRIR
ncbi:DUF4293 domain-containing protein [Marinifilum sp.]|uniref:DUF4293 domain-containing protein n=1 Tax=Marinifilum sp. TaxID=2033137 RepID=UPI003BA87DA5